MGLNNIGPADDDDSSQSSSSTTQSTEEDNEEETIEIGGGANKKVFSQSKWDAVKSVIIEETEYTPDEVLNLPPDDRHEVLHEAALVHAGEESASNMDSETTSRCYSCGVDVTSTGIKIEGEMFCPQHPAAKIRSELDD